MREICLSGSVRGVRSNPYPYRDQVVCITQCSLQLDQSLAGLHKAQFLFWRKRPLNLLSILSIKYRNLFHWAENMEAEEREEIKENPLFMRI